MSRTPRLQRTPAFILVATAFLTLLAAASAPSPLYVVYQARWHFSATMLTTVFAVYALTLLVALLTVGSLSDYIGRRPVLIASLVLEAIAMLLFGRADGTAWLLAARAVQGFATGAATGTAAAALVDLQPRPGLGSLCNGIGATGGLAFGALGSGLLVQDAPDPTVLVYVILAAVFVIAAAAVPFIPDLGARRPGALSSLRPVARVPRRARAAFLALVPAIIAVWALCGLMLSLGGSLAANVLGIDNHLIGGLVVTALCLPATAGSLTMRGKRDTTALSVGSAIMVAGIAIMLAGLAGTSVGLFFAGVAVGGYGYGSAFLGTLTTASKLADRSERAEFFAAVYVVSYLAFALPSVLAGLAVPHIGLETVASIYGGFVGVSALAALTAAVFQPNTRPHDHGADTPNRLRLQRRRHRRHHYATH